MQVTREDLNPCTVKLTVVCEPEEVKQGYEVAFRQLTKKVKLPGFRPGKAPKAMLEGLIQPQELTEVAAEEIVRKNYLKAIESQEIEPDRSTAPSVELTSINQAEGRAEFSVKVPLPPKVELGEYKGLPLEQPPADVTDEEVEYQLTELRKRSQTREAITERGVEEGDVAVVNIKLDGTEGEGRNFMTIAGQTFPELDGALAGMKLEEMKSLDLTFPENFQEKDWAGQTHHAQVTLNSLSSVKLPDLDDSFAKSLNTENVDDLKNRLREGIGSAKQQLLRQMLHERLLETLREKSVVHVSDNMWETLADRRLRETAEDQAKNHQKSLETYATEQGMTLDSLVEAWRTRAKIEVERALLIQTIYAQEQMTLTNQDLNQELIEMAREYELPPQELLTLLQQNQALDELQFRTLARKVGDFLLANADITMQTVGSAEAADKPKKADKAEEGEAKPAARKRAPKKAE